MNATRGNKRVGFQNTTRRRTYNTQKPSSTSTRSNNTVSLKDPHAVPDYAYLSNFLPANHYNSEAKKATLSMMNNLPQYEFDEEDSRIAANITKNATSFLNINNRLINLLPSDFGKDDYQEYLVLFKKLDANANKSAKNTTRNRRPISKPEFHQIKNRFFRTYVRQAIQQMSDTSLNLHSKHSIVNALRRQMILSKLGYY